MGKDKSFALYAMTTRPSAAQLGNYKLFSLEGRNIWVRAEIHHCNYNDAMDAIALRDGENFLNTQPA